MIMICGILIHVQYTQVGVWIGVVTFFFVRVVLATACARAARQDTGPRGFGGDNSDVEDSITERL